MYSTSVVQKPGWLVRNVCSHAYSRCVQRQSELMSNCLLYTWWFTVFTYGCCFEHFTCMDNYINFWNFLPAEGVVCWFENVHKLHWNASRVIRDSTSTTLNCNSWKGVQNFLHHAPDSEIFSEQFNSSPSSHVGRRQCLTQFPDRATVACTELKLIRAIST